MHVHQNIPIVETIMYFKSGETFTKFIIKMADTQLAHTVSDSDRFINTRISCACHVHHVHVYTLNEN